MLLKTYMGHGYEVLDAQASCDSAHLVSGGMDKMVIQWDVSTGGLLRRFRGHVGQVNCVAFNEESTVALSGSIDGSVRIWDCRSKKSEPIQILEEAKDSVTSIKVSDHEILASSADSRIRRYDLRNGALFTDTVGKAVSSVSFTRDGQCILASCMDSTVKLLDKDTGELLQEFSGHVNKDYKIDSCLSNTDSAVFSGSEDGNVYCWDLVEGTIKAKLDHQTKRPIHSLSHHPNEATLSTACEGFVFLWKADLPETTEVLD